MYSYPMDWDLIQSFEKYNNSSFMYGNVFFESKFIGNESTNNAFELRSISIDVPVKMIILSLWFWWKEFIFVALSSVIVFLLVLMPRFWRGQVVVIERHIPVVFSNAKPTSQIVMQVGVDTPKTSENKDTKYQLEYIQNLKNNFLSRFREDFELVRCLGCGGFGVVFEVKNKLDDCKYAIKRITLPNTKKSRMRVMREVKTLANCENKNIVRYFQAWIEKPPPGWQENADFQWLRIKEPKSTKSNNTDLYAIFSTSKSMDKQNVLSNKKREIKQEIHAKEENKFDSNIPLNYKTASRQICGKRVIGIDKHLKTSSFCKEIKSTPRKYYENSREVCCTNYSFPSNSSQIEFIDSDHNQVSVVGEKQQKFESEERKKKRSKIFLYIQMELCRKESFRDWLRANKTSARQIHMYTIYQQILNAVEYVHFKGLIHRDLKPSNIFFSQDGEIKIGDFGLVKNMLAVHNTNICNHEFKISSGACHTQKVGTHLYMSPEQLRGQNYDFKVDIYSLGLVLFELLVYFDTEMERVVTLLGIREGKYPPSFSHEYPQFYKLLQIMLSTVPKDRPSTTKLKYQLNIAMKSAFK